MNWIRICVDIADDPAIGAIADACNIPIAEALGAVVAVLCKLPAHAKAGLLDSVPDRTLEKWANWEHERGVFAVAFRAAMCDEAGQVRSWERHNGAAMREAEAARERMRTARQNRKQTTTRTHDEPSVEGAANVRRTSPQPFASNGTRRNETIPPSSPIGSEVPPAHSEPSGAVSGSGTATDAGPLFADWERQLFAAALPHEAAALEAICARASFRPAVIGELYAIASGQHVVRGQHTGREATAADVMRAVSEFACKARDWHTGYFRGVVRAILDRKPEPPDAAEREQQRLAKELRAAMPAITVDTPRTPEEIEAGRARREAAMALFREEAMRNREGERRATPERLGSIVQTLVA